MNALNTVWDLMLVKPYRDGGPALNAWDIAGLKSADPPARHANRPGDKDEGWSIEIAMPWKILKEAAPGQRPPTARRTMARELLPRAMVARREGRQVREADGRKGQLLPENNWVWSPQGAINMHMPERWGYVQFSSRTAGDRRRHVRRAARRSAEMGPAPHLLPAGGLPKRTAATRGRCASSKRWPPPRASNCTRPITLRHDRAGQRWSGALATGWPPLDRRR